MYITWYHFLLLLYGHGNIYIYENGHFIVLLGNGYNKQDNRYIYFFICAILLFFTCFVLFFCPNNLSKSLAMRKNVLVILFCWTMPIYLVFI